MASDCDTLKIRQVESLMLALHDHTQSMLNSLSVPGPHPSHLPVCHSLGNNECNGIPALKKGCYLSNHTFKCTKVSSAILSSSAVPITAG